MAAVIIVIVSSEAEADAVNAHDVDNVDKPLTYFFQLLMSGRMAASVGVLAVGATTAVAGGGGRIFDDRWRQRRRRNNGFGRKWGRHNSRNQLLCFED